MAARSVVIVALEPIVERIRLACPDIDVQASSLDQLEEAVIQAGPSAVATWDIPSEKALPVLTRVRAWDRGVHLTLITTLTDADGRLAALAAGVDEALPPIDVDELAGRLRLATRRAPARRREHLPIDGRVSLDLRRRELFRDGLWVHLRPKEARLLEVLLRADGRPLTRTSILARVWGSDHQGDPRTVDVHVRWLRARSRPIRTTRSACSPCAASGIAWRRR